MDSSGQKQTEGEINPEKRREKTEIERNGKKMTKTDRKDQKRTKTERK